MSGTYWTIRYRWETTAMDDVLFDGVGPCDTAEDAMEQAFQGSGHDDREGFFRDLEAVKA